MRTRKRIIIVGAGFAGLRLAQDLRNSPYEIYLFDKNNYHQFQPLMYQVASARLEPASISFPLRKVFQKCKHIHIRIGEALSVSPSVKLLNTSIGAFEYDYLVLAMGCDTNYFGNKLMQRYAYPMKSVPESIQLRNRMLQTFEDAVIAPPHELQSLLNFVIVGGGPTGVELSGALAEMKKNILPKDYPDQDFSKLAIFLLEGSPNLLNVMSEDSKKAARRYLEELGVTVMTSTIVEEYDGHTVKLKSGQQIPSKNVVWAAGVIGNTMEGIPKELAVRGNRLPVNRFNEVVQLQDIYVVGDVAYMTEPKYPNGHPQVASVAIAQAKNLAKNFRALASGRMKNEFSYKDKGSMATVGKRKAVVDLPGFSFQGRFAWFTWMFVHLMLILSIKNKLSIFINWSFSYFNNDSTLRVLLKPARKQIEAEVTHTEDRLR